MTHATPDPRAELEADFSRARERLVQARHRQQEKDTPDHRAAVAACLASTDLVLDLYLTVGAARADMPAAARGRPAPPHAAAADALRLACGAAPGPF
jgi:hypothetical protein